METPIHLFDFTFLSPKKKDFGAGWTFQLLGLAAADIALVAWAIEPRTDMTFLALLQQSVGKVELTFSCNDVLEKQTNKQRKNLCSSCELTLSELSC